MFKKLGFLVLLLSSIAHGQLKSLSCASASITGAGNTTCTVTTIPAGTGWPGNDIATVSLQTNNAALTVPANHWEANGVTSFTFTATAKAVATKTTVIVTAFYNANGGNSETFTITLNPIGVTPPPATSFTASPASLSFSSVVVGAASVIPITLTSSGAAVTYGVQLQGTGFYLAGTFEGSLASTGTATLEVLFSPGATGGYSGSLLITSNSITSPTITIPLTGTGVAGGTTAAYTAALSWSAPSTSTDPVATYTVQRSDGKAFAGINALAYTDSTVVAGSTYTYDVVSVDAQGNQSVPSNSVTAVIP